MKEIKKWAACLFLVAILLELLQSPADAKTKKLSGSCGEAATYLIDAEGTLTITGTGKIDKVFSDDEAIVWDENVKIRKIVMSEGITELGDSCFQFLDDVKTIEFPDSLRVIGVYAMNGMTALKEIEIPEQLEQIDEGALYNCGKLEEIYIPDSVNKIGPKVFAYCEKLQHVRLPEKIEKIPDEMFKHCESLEKIVDSNAVRIGNSAYVGCSSLEKVTIPESVQEIGALTFENCKNLKKITIGPSVKKIAKSYARGSIRLRKVVNHSDITVPLWNDKERLIWRVGNKKSAELPAGKTAKAEGKKYPIEYYLNGARLKGKMPKYHEYGIRTKLPRVARKGYTFLGWDVYDFSRDENFGYVQTGIKDYYYGKIQVSTECKKYKVTVRNRRIHVMVKSPMYGKKGYYRRDDYYGFRYSENEDMSNAVIIDKTAPYGKGLSGKLKKGKTYYVEISPHAPAMFEEDSEDFPMFAWRAKRKVKIK